MPNITIKQKISEDLIAPFSKLKFSKTEAKEVLTRVFMSNNWETV